MKSSVYVADQHQQADKQDGQAFSRIHLGVIRSGQKNKEPRKAFLFAGIIITGVCEELTGAVSG
jgi:hypothetical protein